jgi:hypothetical protein
MPKKNNHLTDGPGRDPQYAVELDLTTASSTAFYAAIEEFYNWNETQPDPGPLNLDNGWHTVSPLQSQDFLRRNVCNRQPKLAPVRRYHYDMTNNHWHRTGQGLVFNVAGKLNEGQQRCWASYFGKVSFPTFIVTDAPDEQDLFAYYDDNAPRTEGDALHTSGLNSFSSPLAQAVHLAWKYENEVLGVFKQPKVQKLNKREVLDYARAHPSLTETGHVVFPTYGKAISIIDHKGVALMFSDLVIRTHGPEALDRFLVPLGTGANLEENSPILGLRSRLQTNDVEKERKLALLIKAFNYHMVGKTLSKRGLYVADNETFPKISVFGQDSQGSE